MPKFKLQSDCSTSSHYITTDYQGADLLNHSKLNKGCAFSDEERKAFSLTSLLPAHVETLQQQSIRMYLQYQAQTTPLAKNIFLNNLHDTNETLFFKLVSEYLEEMLPIIYTPTVGEAVQCFSKEFRRPKGLYISYQDREYLDEILDTHLPSNLEITVITDGEAVLGIGDQGVGGMHIASAKLMVYSLCGGINPFHGIAIQIDVGTNNETLLNDPMYLGWRHRRITDAEYDEFISTIVTKIQKRFPNNLFHWEDFSRRNARQILDMHQNSTCTFNDDIQGTGVVALASILAATKISNISLANHRIVIFGAGSAGIGIAEQIFNAMLKTGISHEKASQCFWLLNSKGLITKTETLQQQLIPFARDKKEIENWQRSNHNKIDLYDVVNNVKPTILIGSSTVPNSFSENIIRTMAANTPKPIILPLSNPNELSEATPENLFNWTNGQAIIATGSPFPDVNYQGKTFRISQCNNALAYPGIGLGATIIKATKISENMLWAATCALSKYSPALQDPNAPLLPKLSQARQISAGIALAVAEAAIEEGIAQCEISLNELPDIIERAMWSPRYYSLKK